ncbi:hypothetical protein SAMN02746095_02995 [Acidocella aminolytica 101 = DSM 11237]|uniref:Uncharacterized protein n=1 Tax=Acidocella aminolytica 101 = DSM 11237 TaxID=1120923 RepID=A0A0D6PF22_9PROT|nr:hypothetical protein Aam_030_036 [Acidocella aminolytica 101 = DSM 11237]GBQ34306.1 hypothetical protein AA11237_0709 [Acidocella aminolytica 101 = DSM 11237]SHF36595.1 hypothetical protein SAMN02746095_02995 [Acidocella aminolytica 101 = DSM 11237]
MNIEDGRLDRVWAENCFADRGRVLTGWASHYCPDFDGLTIDETCPQWPCLCADELKERNHA